MSKQDKQVLEMADSYAKPEDQYEWRIYWRDLGKVLKDAR